MTFFERKVCRIRFQLKFMSHIHTHTHSLTRTELEKRERNAFFSDKEEHSKKYIRNPEIYDGNLIDGMKTSRKKKYINCVVNCEIISKTSKVCCAVSYWWFISLMASTRAGVCVVGWLIAVRRRVASLSSRQKVSIVFFLCCRNSFVKCTYTLSCDLIGAECVRIIWSGRVRMCVCLCVCWCVLDSSAWRKIESAAHSTQCINGVFRLNAFSLAFCLVFFLFGWRAHEICQNRFYRTRLSGKPSFFGAEKSTKKCCVSRWQIHFNMIDPLIVIGKAQCFDQSKRNFSGLVQSIFGLDWGLT